MRVLKCLRNIEIIRKKHEMAVAKQQSEAWRKAIDGVPDSLRMLLEINNTENVPEYSEKQKKQYNVLKLSGTPSNAFLHASLCCFATAISYCIT